MKLMKIKFIKHCVLALLVFSASAYAAGISGTVNGFSVKEKTLTVNNKEYTVDLENIKITYHGEYVGTDPLRQGLKVHLVFAENKSAQNDITIVAIQIITQVPGLES